MCTEMLDIFLYPFYAYKNETIYRTYKNMFEAVKFKSKRNYYNNLINKYKTNIKKTIGKIKQINNSLSRRLIVNYEEIYAKKGIVEGFNNYLINVGPNLACKIPPCTEQFHSYLKPNGRVTEESVSH